VDLTMSTADDFVAFARVADQLIEGVTKEQLAEVARLLALNCGYYQTKYGDVPQEVLLKMVKAERIDGALAPVLVSSMQNLIAALAEVAGLNNEFKDGRRH
jgi:hypothetical protein